MRVMVEPMATPEMDADTIWQLAGFAFSHCRIHIEFEEGDADGERRRVRIERHGGERRGTYVDENGEVIG